MRRIFALALIAVGSICGAGQTLAADTLTLRMRFEGAGRTTTRIVAETAQRSDIALVQPALDEVETGRGWSLQSLDAKGRVLYQTRVRNYAWRRLEAFDPNTGRIQEVREVFSERGAFEVSLPYDTRIARVVLRSGALQGRKSSGTVLIDLRRRQLDALISKPATQARSPRIAEKTLLAAGVAADYLDIVFVGDGYTAAEMGKWASDAQSVADRMMLDPLFAANRSRINIRRIDVASNESGVDEPDKGIFRDTALDAAFNCANLERLLCANGTKVLNVASAALAPDARDVIVVVANSTRYGGSGGWFAAISMHSSATELALHELGHTLFGLADEYEYGTCNTSREPNEGNVSLVATRAVKWGYAIGAATEMPTPTGRYPNGTVGAFAGAQYCAAGKYRPTEDSKMRTLGLPWHAINTALATTIFGRYVGPGKPRVKPVQPSIPAASSP